MKQAPLLYDMPISSQEEPMARILIVHGIGQEFEGPSSLHAKLYPALQDGLSRAGINILAQEVACASYGDAFRPPGEFLAPVPYFDDSDIEPGYEEQFLLAVWESAANRDETVVPPDEEVLSRTPSTARRALAALSSSRFLAGLSERLFIGDLKQMTAYFCDAELRGKILGIAAAAIADDTEVVIGHSLGSVVAYEALFAKASPQVKALITLGSPLGLRNLIFDRLRPPPVPDAVSGKLTGLLPPVRMWGNVADPGDIVALVEDLRPLFGDDIRQARVNNGATPHDMRPYLEDVVTARLIADGLNA
jgi:hypothetical protein